MEKLLIVTGSDSVEAAIRQCFTYPKMELVVLKNGSRGSTLYRRDGSREHIGVYKRMVTCTVLLSSLTFYRKNHGSVAF